jgi:hypothetical protein
MSDSKDITIAKATSATSNFNLLRNVYIWDLHASSDRPISSSKTAPPVIDPHFVSCLNPRETFSVAYFVLYTHTKKKQAIPRKDRHAKQA